MSESPADRPGDYRAGDAAATAERERLRHLGAVADAPTLRRLEVLGLRPGWRGLEVGAGAGSLATALAEAVAPGGHVLAIDIDLRFLDGVAHPNLEVREHDITAGPPETGFDLVHARGVLEHIADRERALAAMVAAARPGGWVVVHDPDWTVFDGQALPAAFRHVHETLRAVYVDRSGYDPYLGSRLPGLLRAHGLVDVDVDGRVSMMFGGTPSMEWYVLGLERALPGAVLGGLITEAEGAQALAEVRDPGCALLSPLHVTAWGRRAG
jgi:SAM-dependent methyltransferase